MNIYSIWLNRKSVDLYEYYAGEMKILFAEIIEIIPCCFRMQNMYFANNITNFNA